MILKHPADSSEKKAYRGFILAPGSSVAADKSWRAHIDIDMEHVSSSAKGSNLM